MRRLNTHKNYSHPQNLPSLPTQNPKPTKTHHFKSSKSELSAVSSNRENSQNNRHMKRLRIVCYGECSQCRCCADPSGEVRICFLITNWCIGVDWFSDVAIDQLNLGLPTVSWGLCDPIHTADNSDASAQFPTALSFFAPLLTITDDANSFV